MADIRPARSVAATFRSDRDADALIAARAAHTKTAAPITDLAQRSSWTVWDGREQASTHSTGLEAHKACVNTRYVSPDTGRRLCLYDPTGRIAAIYVDGREQLDGLSGSAFPKAGAR